MVLQSEDEEFWLDAVKDIKKTASNQIISSTKPNPIKQKEKVYYATKQEFSSYSKFLDDFESGGIDKSTLRKFKREEFRVEAVLDLHGLTREQAKMELAALLLACEDEHVYCASIMTGYGTFTLKKQIPRWLVQHPKVRALHQAPKEWGGEAAILILVDV